MLVSTQGCDDDGPQLKQLWSQQKVAVYLSAQSVRLANTAASVITQHTSIVTELYGKGTQQLSSKDLQSPFTASAAL